MSDAPWLRSSGDAVDVLVYATPRASRSRVVGTHDGRLKVQLAAPPVDGAANDELVACFARLLGVPRAAVTLARGNTSRTKTLRIVGLTPTDVLHRIDLADNDADHARGAES